MRVSRTIERYLARQIYSAVGFVLIAFLGLFAFFDLMGQISDVGRGRYGLREIFVFVLLSAPAHAYELAPVVTLIGTLYVLAHLAGNSEFTVMRGSGLSPAGAARALLRAGAVIAVATFVLGEWVAPATEEAAQSTRMRAMSALIGQDMRSGLWFRDEQSFINVRRAPQADTLEGLRIYEFDSTYRLRRLRSAERGVYRGDGVWALSGVDETQFSDAGPRVSRTTETEWRSVVTPDLINVLVVVPDRMSAWALYRYSEHLASNRQKSDRYDIALWRKVFYPITVLVMMALALPFAYLHARAGRTGVKVFAGVMLGIAFHILNTLFAHVGLLERWPPAAAAAAPGAMFLLAALAMMWWVERR